MLSSFVKLDRELQEQKSYFRVRYRVRCYARLIREVTSNGYYFHCIWTSGKYLFEIGDR